MNPPPATVAFEKSPDYVQSLHRGLDVICAFSRERPAMTLSDLALRTGLSRAVVRRLLLTLEHLGYISREGGRQGRLFALSPRILELGLGYISSLGVARIALPVMQDLADAIQESCSLTVLEGEDIVYVSCFFDHGIAVVRLPEDLTQTARLKLVKDPEMGVARGHR